MVIRMDNCIFCKIINNEIPSRCLYEDDIVKVILDANPDSNGHTLILPKKHITDFEEMDNETLIHINKIAKEIKYLLYKTLNPDGLCLHVNYGLAQVIKHYHLHLIPVYKEKQAIRDLDEIYNTLIK